MQISHGLIISVEGRRGEGSEARVVHLCASWTESERAKVRHRGKHCALKALVKTSGKKKKKKYRCSHTEVLTCAVLTIFSLEVWDKLLVIVGNLSYSGDTKRRQRWRWRTRQPWSERSTARRCTPTASRDVSLACRSTVSFGCRFEQMCWTGDFGVPCEVYPQYAFIQTTH